MCGVPPRLCMGERRGVLQDRISAGKSHHPRDGIIFLSLIPETLLVLPGLAITFFFFFFLVAVDSNNAQLSIWVPAG